MVIGSPEQIEEERRLFYVALIRVESRLAVRCPLHDYRAAHGPANDSYGYVQLPRFIPDEVKACCACRATESFQSDEDETPSAAESIRQQARAMGTWARGRTQLARLEFHHASRAANLHVEREGRPC